MFLYSISLHLDASYVLHNTLNNVHLLILILVALKYLKISFFRHFMKGLKIVYGVVFIAFDIQQHVYGVI
jgi:hypothetical protein